MREKWASSANWVSLNPTVIKTHRDDLDKSQSKWDGGKESEGESGTTHTRTPDSSFETNTVGFIKYDTQCFSQSNLVI